MAGRLRIVSFLEGGGVCVVNVTQFVAASLKWLDADLADASEAL
jgi:hypothetical protein